MFGFLNVYKPKGMTSHDVVSILRKITGIKQIGHAGTLDPFAEGVLPIGIGKATKLFEYLDDDKAYLGTIKLGVSTTTYDTEGEIVNQSQKSVLEDEIKSVLKRYTGPIMQLPPIYSAIKVKGKKLYEYARNSEEVEIEPRKITINKLDIVNFDSVSNELTLYIDCSKGTYIRSIANDVGNDLGTFGHLNKLIRVKAGKFIVENAIKLDNIKSYNDVETHLINPLNYLKYPKYQVNNSEYKLISNGNLIKTNLSDGITLITYDDNIIAVGNSQNGSLKPQKVFI
jgi:tRNA pseudouridine55 synthase